MIGREFSFNLERMSLRLHLTLVSISGVKEVLWRIWKSGELL